jgi:hypothetical protein
MAARLKKYVSPIDYNSHNISEQELKILEDLYRINSLSHFEREMSEYVCELLDAANVQYHKFHHMIYMFRENKPMICAHMDQVTTGIVTQIVYNKDKTVIRSKGKTAAIGGDDKNGVWILLQILRDPKYLNELSFCFSTGEETGGEIDTVLTLYGKKVLDTIPYCLVFDRMGSSDVIGTYNGYCDDDLIDDMKLKMEKYGYIETQGLWSDCDLIAPFIPCVNIACGYYKPHTDDDYTILPVLENSLNFGMALLDNLNKPDYLLGDVTRGLGHGRHYGYDHDDKSSIRYVEYDPKTGEWIEKNGEPEQFEEIETACDKCNNFDKELCMDCEQYGEDHYYDNYDGEGYRVCPSCDSTMTVDSQYTIGDSQCVKCGAVYDEVDGAIHFYENWKGDKI